MKQKILLIQPYLRDFYKTSARIWPLGLLYLAASLIKHGFKVAILDALAKDSKITLPIPREISYLKEFYQPGNLSPFRLFGHYYHFGLTKEEIAEAIKKSGAKIFGISANFTAYFEEALEIAEIIKKIRPESLVIFGGSHTTLLPEATLKHPSIDAVVLGEGEKRLPLLIKYLLKKNYQKLSKIDGIGYKIKNKIFILPIKKFCSQLDKLPGPQISLINFENYKIRGEKSLSLFSSRGCPHNCRFCAVAKIWGKKFRAHSAERVIEEIKEGYRNGAKIFNFEDDNFTFDKKRTLEILDLIIKNFGPRTLKLYAMNGLETSHLDRELLEKMWRAGFSEINLSVVSLDDRLNKNLRRPFGQKKFMEIYCLARKIGFKINAYIILGLPGQTKKQLIQTIRKLAGLELIIGPSFFYPVPATDLCKNSQNLSPLQFRSSVLPLETKNLSRLELVTFFRIIRLINFLKKGLPQEAIQKKCLNLFLKTKNFYGVKKISPKKYKTYPEKSDQKLIDKFFKTPLKIQSSF